MMSTLLQISWRMWQWRILKIGQLYLTKLCVDYVDLLFLAHPVLWYFGMISYLELLCTCEPVDLAILAFEIYYPYEHPAPNGRNVVSRKMSTGWSVWATRTFLWTKVHQVFSPNVDRVVVDHLFSDVWHPFAIKVESCHAEIAPNFGRFFRALKF